MSDKEPGSVGIHVDEFERGPVADHFEFRVVRGAVQSDGVRQTPDSAALILPDGRRVPRDARFRRDGTVLVESDLGERARRVGELDGLRSYGGQTSWTAKEERERSEVRRLFDDGCERVALGSAPRWGRNAH